MYKIISQNESDWKKKDLSAKDGLWAQYGLQGHGVFLSHLGSHCCAAYLNKLNVWMSCDREQNWNALLPLIFGFRRI